MTTPEVKRLVKRLDELAPSLPPPRDLWPAIAQAIEADRAAAAHSVPRRRTWWMPAAGMAAAVALVSLGVLIGKNIESGTNPVTASNRQGGDPAVMPAALRDANY